MALDKYLKSTIMYSIGDFGIDTADGHILELNLQQ